MTAGQEPLRGRKGVQLIEEALLLSVALVALSLLVGGMESILKEASTYTAGVWDSVKSALSGIFGTAFQW